MNRGTPNPPPQPASVPPAPSIVGRISNPSGEPGSNPERREGPPSDDALYKVALVHFISNVTTLIVGLALFSALLLFFLRRFGISLQVAPRLEASDRRLMVELEPPPQPVPELEPLASGERAPHFDLGLTYAEEMQLKQEATRQQEETILRHLFEQNLRLREQIDCGRC